MKTQESSVQKPPTNPGEVPARSEPSPKGEPAPPTTTTTSSSSRPRRQWSRLQSAKNRLKALESINSHSSPSQLQPQDDGPSSQGGFLPKDRDTSTPNETTDDTATGNGIAENLSAHKLPTEKPPSSETATHDPPASEHNKDKSEPDARNPPPESCKQGRGAASPPPMSVDKAAEDSTKLLGLPFEILLWTLVYRVIYLEHRQGFSLEEYDKVQYVSVKVGERLHAMHYHLRERQHATTTEHPDTATTRIPTGIKPEITVMAMAQTPMAIKPEMAKAATTQLPVDVDQAIETMKEFLAESLESIEAKSAWLQRVNEFSESLNAVDPAGEAIPRLGLLPTQLIVKQQRIKAAVVKAKRAELPKMLEKISAQTPTAKKPQMVKPTAAQLPRYIAQAIKEMEAFQAESPETVEAKSAWLEKWDKFGMSRLVPLRDQAEAILAAENVSLKERALVAKSTLAMVKVGEALKKKSETVRTAIAEATATDLPEMPETTSAQTPEETQEALTQATPKTQRLTVLRYAVAQLPEIAEDTELPIALKKKAAETATTLRRARASLPIALQKFCATPAQIWEAALIVKELKTAESAITARLKMTEVTVEEPAADSKHAGPTYPWGIFQELEKVAKTTMDYEVSMARLGLEEREADLRDVTGAQLRLKKIKSLLGSIQSQCCGIVLELVSQGKSRA